MRFVWILLQIALFASGFSIWSIGMGHCIQAPWQSDHGKQQKMMAFNFVRIGSLLIACALALFWMR